MKISFSTLACPDWTLTQAVHLASASHYDGIELRFIQNEDLLWKLPAFSSDLAGSRRLIEDAGLVVACVDTSCHFHSPEAVTRSAEIDTGERMADLAESLGARGIRVFGDKVQPGASREQTRTWIAESIALLAGKIKGRPVEIWLETHGDFASSGETASVLRASGSRAAGAVWDAANCFIETGEEPPQGAAALASLIRHVHIKDLRNNGGKWEPALPGQGSFPMEEVLAGLHRLRFDGFVSFEWEKKWYPEIPDASVAVPRFAEWYRKSGAA